MKVIAWHLPQYHAIKENDEWWGGGFTEWTNVKKTKPLFKGHNQPRIPLDENYYNMLERETVKWQCELSQKYGIYGFCYYHYWFGNGKMVLEKPVENLLAWKDIPQKFCFSWANEQWARTWTGKEHEILIAQEYPGKEDWKMHIEYLLPFFKDDRYIKVDGKPLFLIYRAKNIPQIDDMIDYFDDFLIENDLPGLHIVETINSFWSRSKERSKEHCKKTAGFAWMEPMVSMREIAWKGLTQIKYKFQGVLKKVFKTKKPYIIKYNSILKKMKKRSIKNNSNKSQYLGLFVDWDNTARKGSNGLVVTGANIERFKKQLEIVKQKSTTDIVFINAWNEWAEGTYLEPDVKNGHAYLEEIQKFVDNY